MKSVKERHKVDGHTHKNKSTYKLLLCSGEEGVMEDVKGDESVYKVDGHMHKNKSTYRLLCR